MKKDVLIHVRGLHVEPGINTISRSLGNYTKENESEFNSDCTVRKKWIENHGKRSFNSCERVTYDGHPGRG